MIVTPRRLIFAALLLGALPAHAGQVEDYIAARNKAMAAMSAAVKAGKDNAQLEKLEDGALADLQKRMTALLGPLKFKGLDPNPAFSPPTLYPDDLGDDSPDGLVFTKGDGGIFLLVSPEPVFTDWLKARAAEESAPEAFKGGIMAATQDDFFFTLTVSRDAAFSTYVALPVTPAAGEKTYAALGLFAQDLPADMAPNSVVVLRVADGRVFVASAEVKLQVPPMPACTALWQKGAAKAKALMEEVQKSDKTGDPRMDEAFEMEEEAASAFRACFAKAAPGQPFLAAATKAADAILKTMRGQ